MTIFKKQKGFTLVELLVVLAIIGILLALAVGGIRIVQEVNRDTQRKALVRDIQLSLESYNEKHNSYPENAKGIFLEKNEAKGVMTICACSPSGSCNAICTGGEKVESKASFEPTDENLGADCENWTSSEAEQDTSNFTYCYYGGAKAYTLNVLLERTNDIYNAGNE